MQERAEQRNAEKEFNAAFVRVSAKLPRVKRNGTIELPIRRNDTSESPRTKAVAFARWEDIDRLIRPILAEEGMALAWR